MKSWLVALGASVGLHVAAVGLAWSPEPAAQVKAAAPRKTMTTIPISVFSAPASGVTQAARSVKAAEPVKRKARSGRSEPVEDGPAAETIGSGLSELVEDGPAEAGEAGSPLTPTLAPSGGEGGADGSPSGGEGGGEVDVTGLVHARLAAVADRCYPAAARRFQQRGTVHLSFCTDASGAAKNTSVTQSSGAELLDGAARGCVVESASPFPPEAASRCFAVPVRFGVR